MSEWKIFRLNDVEWWCARSHDEAVTYAINYTGADPEEVYDGSYPKEPLSNEEMKALSINDEGVTRSFEKQLYIDVLKGITNPFLFASTEC